MQVFLRTLWIAIFLGCSAAKTSDINETRSAVLSSSNDKQDYTYEKSVALVIGINDYSDPKYDDLDGAKNDAIAMAQMLTAQGFAVTQLIDKDATKKAIEDAILYLGNELGGSKDSRFVFYFAGHGTPEDVENPEAGYIMPVEASNYLNGFNMAELKDVINKQIPSKHKLLLLDSCHAGFAITPKTRSMSKELSSTFDENVSMQLVASMEMEKAIDNYKGHGLFTYYVLKALKGFADDNEDGFITSEEIARYVSRRVSATAKDKNRVQTPGLYSDGAGTMVFRELSNEELENVNISASISSKEPTPSSKNGRLKVHTQCVSEESGIQSVTKEFDLPSSATVMDVLFSDKKIEVLLREPEYLNLLYVYEVSLVRDEGMCASNVFDSDINGQGHLGDINQDGLTDVLLTPVGTMPYDTNGKLLCDYITQDVSSQVQLSTEETMPVHQIRGSERDDVTYCKELLSRDERTRYRKVTGGQWGLELMHIDLEDVDADGDLDIVLADQMLPSHKELCGCKASGTCAQSFKLNSWVDPSKYGVGKVGVFDSIGDVGTDNGIFLTTLRSDGHVLFGNLDLEPGKDLFVMKDDFTYEAWMARLTESGVQYEHQGKEAGSHKYGKLRDGMNNVSHIVLLDINGDNLDDLVFLGSRDKVLDWMENRMSDKPNPILYKTNFSVPLLTFDTLIQSFYGATLTSKQKELPVFKDACQTVDSSAVPTSVLITVDDNNQR